MKRILLIGLLSLCGASLFAMKLPTVSEIQRLLAEDEQVVTMVKAFKKSHIDIDTCECTAGKTYEALFTELRQRHALFLAKNIDFIFAELEPYRSNPPGAHELRMLVSVGANDLDPVKIEEFCKNKRLNIDLISYGGTSPLTIGTMLDGARNREDVKAVLRLERIREFRYNDDSLLLMNELLNEVFDGTSTADAFQKLFRDMVNKKKPVDVDILKAGYISRQTIGEKLGLLLHCLNREALLVAECVQPYRTDKEATIRILFKVFEIDPKQVGPLTAWFKKFPVDIDCVPYDVTLPHGEKLGDKLENLVAAKVSEAVPLAELMNAWRMRVHVELNKAIASYRSSKTSGNLKAIEECFKRCPFDIDSTSNLGAVIDRLNDYEVSAIFYQKRSKKTALPVKSSVPDPKPSLKGSNVTPRNVVIALAALGVSCYIWYKRSQNAQQEDKEARPILS